MTTIRLRHSTRTDKQYFSQLRLAACALAIAACNAQAAVIVDSTPTNGELAAFLGGTGLTLNSVAFTSQTFGMAQRQAATYWNFSQGPVTFTDGVLLSTGDTYTAAYPGAKPSGVIGTPGTPEFNAYGATHIQNFSRSDDVARLQVDFTLNAPTAVAFDFIFGSAEYSFAPNMFPDAFIAFLDGTTNQIIFDSNNQPVQVGSFPSRFTTADQNTAFSGANGLLKPLATTTEVLAAGSHTILFEIGDGNDEQLDSAVFISNFRTSSGIAGTVAAVPVPGAAMLFGSGCLGLVGLMRRKAS